MTLVLPPNDIAEIVTGTDPLVNWLIPDLLPEGYLVVLAGKPSVGKSVWAYNLGHCLATGQSFLGFPPSQPLKVLHFDQENSQADMRQYNRWAWHGIGCPDPSLLNENFRVAHFQLGGPKWFDRAYEWLDAVCPHVFIIDTATPCCYIQAENDNSEASLAVRKLRTLQYLTNPPMTCLVLKHEKEADPNVKEKDQPARTIRGAKDWLGACDSALFLGKAPGHPFGNGLFRTILMPFKGRAFGLSEHVHITPEWLPPNKRGLALHRTYVKER